MWDLPRLFPPKEALLKVSTHSQTKTQHCLHAVVRSLEATYEIREDLADALGRVGAFWDDSGEEPVVGAACHAAACAPVRWSTSGVGGHVRLMGQVRWANGGTLGQQREGPVV